MIVFTLSETLETTRGKVGSLVNALSEKTGIPFKIIPVLISDFGSSKEDQIRVIALKEFDRFDFTLYFHRGKFNYVELREEYYFNGSDWLNVGAGTCVRGIDPSDRTYMLLLEHIHHEMTKHEVIPVYSD